jgi:hypothetical protein
MKVLCIANQGEALPAQYLDPRIPRGPKSEFFVTVGKTYVVYALRFLVNQVWYYIDDDHHEWYPIRKPAPLFQVIDPRLSKYWSVRVSESDRGSDVLIAFQEWSMDVHFYDRLTDRMDAEVSMFRERKRQMDAEFEVEVSG